jgi:hypothetical protein
VLVKPSVATVTIPTNGFDFDFASPGRSTANDGVVLEDRSGHPHLVQPRLAYVEGQMMVD